MPGANSAATSKNKSLVDQVYIFVDNNLRAVQYTLYVVGAVGAVIVARSLHVHKKFNKLSDIPVSFISKNVPFRASVKAIDREHLLHVDHIPIVASRWIRFNRGDELLSIKLACVHITPIGSKWLADNVLNRVVKVTPLNVSKGVLESIVSLEKGVLRKSVCINKALVEQGLCKVDYPDPLPTSDLHMKLLDSLVSHETKADRKGRGSWGKTLTENNRTVKQQGRWRLKTAWNWLCGKFVKRKT